MHLLLKESDMNENKNIKIVMRRRDSRSAKHRNKVGMIAQNSSVYIPTLHIFHYVKIAWIEGSCLHVPVFVSDWYGISVHNNYIPTSHYIFNVFYSCYYIYQY